MTPGMCAVPPWPLAGAAVADELDRACPRGACPATDEWIGRLSKLKDQLEAAR